jgi:competence protein ComFB
MDLLNRDGIDYEIEGCMLNDIINFNELMVLRAMRDVLETNTNFCRCSFCIEDVFALTLNKLPPRYIQITSIEKYAQSQNFVTAEEAREKILDAWEKISRNPNH